MFIERINLAKTIAEKDIRIVFNNVLRKKMVFNHVKTGMEKINRFQYVFMVQNMGKFRKCAAVSANPIVFHRNMGC